jgi:pantothenate kinase
MDPEIVDELAQSALDDLAAQPKGSRVIIGIAGVPGAGKTTLAAAVTARINQLHPSPSSPVAVAVPMDGFHYTRAHLATMPDPAEAIARRGAAFTFDADGFLALIRKLSTSPVSETIRAPSFEHEIKTI